MSAPQKIGDVLKGPYVQTLVYDGPTAIVVAEPLRPVIIGSDTMGDWNARVVAFEERRRG